MQGPYMVSGDVFPMFLLSDLFQASYKPDKLTVCYSLFLVAEGTFIKFFSSQEFFQQFGELCYFASPLDQHWEVLSQLSEKFNLAWCDLLFSSHLTAW